MMYMLAIVVLINALLTTANDEEGVCYWDNLADPKFYIAPATEIDAIINGIQCQSSCLKSTIDPAKPVQYAGLQNYTTELICLCAMKIDETRKCDAKCDTCNDIASVKTVYYKLSATPVTINKITCTEKDSEHNAHEVTFKIEPELNNSIKYYFHFDDNDEFASNFVPDKAKYEYFVPGDYLIAVEAANPATQTSALNFESVSIQQQLAKNFTLDCPEQSRNEEEICCNIKLDQGSNLTMVLTVTNKDGVPEEMEESIPDPVMFTAGSGVPQAASENFSAVSFGNPKIIMLDSTISHSGFIHGFQIYGVTKGDVELVILKLDTSEDYCPLNETCTDKAFHTCLTSVADPTKQTLSVVATVDDVNSIEEGYQYIALAENKRIAVSPGMIIAYSSKSGQIASRNASDVEVSDYETDSYNKLGTPTGRRHFIRAIIQQPLELVIQKKFKEPSIYDISVKITSSLTPEKPLAQEKKLQIWIPVQGLELTASHESQSMNSPIKFTGVVENGSDINILWMCDTDVTLMKTDEINGKVSGQSFEIEHSFLKVGNHTVTLFVNNSYSETLNKSITVEIEALLKKEEWNFTSNSPQFYPSGSIKFELKYVGKIFNSTVSAKLNFGDDSPVTNKNLEDIPKQQTFEFEHEYQKPDNFTATLELSDNLSNISMTVEVRTILKIKLKKINVQYFEKPGSDYREGLGSGHKLIPVNSDVKIQIEKNDATVNTYFIDWGDEELKETPNKNNTVVRKFDKIGRFTITVYGANNVENQSNKVSVDIEVAQLLHEVIIKEADKIADMGEDKDFRVDFINHYTCVFIDYGDDTYEKYGDKDLCQSDKYPKGDYIKELPDESPLMLAHIYMERKYYTLEKIAFNNYDSNKQTLRFVINNFPYAHKPLVFIRVNSTNVQRPLQYRSSDGYKLETNAILPPDFVSSFEIDVNWTMSHVNPDTGVIIDPSENLIDRQKFNSWNKTSLFLLPRLIKYGVYKIIYRFYISTHGMNREYPIFSEDYTFIEVTKTPLSPSLIEGNLFEVTKGWNQSVVLNPKQLSMDPDDLESKNFTITWHCSRLSDKSSIKHEVETVQEIPKPSDKKPSNDKGGCFGNGPGLVKIKDDVWELQMNTLYKFDESYLIEAIVEKDTRKSVVELVLRVTQFDTIDIKVLCAVAASCTPVQKGFSINPSSRQSFKAECKECPPETEYKWQIQELTRPNDHLEWHEKPEATEHLIGKGKPFVALMSTLFETYSDIEMFVISVEAHAPREERTKRSTPAELKLIGKAALKMVVNKPPEKGKCVIISKGTYALLDTFDVKCSDWIDPEGIGIGTYEIFTEDAVGFKNVLLLSSDTEFSLILKPGTLKLFATVRDILEAKTTVEIITGLEVKMPDQKLFLDYLSSGQLLLTKKTGNQFLFMQALQGIGEVTSNTFPDKQSVPKKDDENFDFGVLLSKTITENLQNMADITISNFNDLQLVALTLGATAGTGNLLNRLGKNVAIESIVQLMKKLRNSTLYQFNTPQEAEDFATGIFSIAGAVMESVANTVLQGVYVPSDVQDVDEIEYDTSVKVNDASFAIPTDHFDQQLLSIREDTLKYASDQTAMVDEIISDVVGMLMENLVPGEDSINIVTQSRVTATITSFDASKISTINTTLGSTTFKLPDYCKLSNQDSDNCDKNAPLGVSAIEWGSLVQVAGKNLNRLSPRTKVVEIDIFTGKINANTKLSVSNVTEPIDIFIPRYPKLQNSSANTSATPIVIPKLKWFEDMMYHQILIKYPDSAFTIQFTTSETTDSYAMFLQHNKKPTLDETDHKWIIQENNFTDDTFEYNVDTNTIRDKTGAFYLGIIQLKPNATHSAEITKTMINRNWTSSYQMKTLVSSCVYYNKETKSWSTDGCWVVSSTELQTHCQCTHLTPFGSGFVVPPNPIDFSYVFAHASFADNLTIYMTILITVIVYILFMIWARHKDKKDKEKLGALPLPDNNIEDKYLYEILVFTGDVTGASTDSKVSFILSGDKDETTPRQFGIHSRKTFRRNATDVFVMAVPRPLGQLQFLRIWHDNSGKDAFASWYLSYVVFRDVQTGEKFEFIGNTWLALERDAGEIDHVIPVADKELLTEFNHLFTTNSRKNIADGHLWFSVFLRPARSRFTRCQRVSCCMALLYLSMLVNAMWYGTVPEKPAGNSMKFGPFHVSPEQIAVGFFSNLIIFPPSFLIIFLFRKSRPRTLRPSRIDQALNKQRSVNSILNQTPSSSKDNLSAVKYKPLKYLKKRKFTLPWWFSVVAWILCVASMGLSVFFLWAYGIQFGNDKTKKWVTSLIVSFFSSIFLTQPIQIFLVAMFISAICKKTETDDDDADEDEEDPHLHFDEEWLHSTTAPTKPKQARLQPSHNPELVEKARQRRIEEVKTWDIIKEIIIYLVFLWLLSIIGYGTYDPNSFWMQQTIHNDFLKPKSSSSYFKINTIEHFWKWATDILLSRIRVTRAYNNDPPYGMKGYMADSVNRMIGYAIMRQIREEPGHCKTNLPYLMNCSAVYSTFLHEDTTSFTRGWKKEVKDQKTEDFIDRAFLYQTSESLNGFPFVGHLNVYGGGGYVYDLTKSTDQIINDFHKLRENDWINGFTRAVLVEFSAYNAQVNLFTVARFFIEFAPGGTLMADYLIDAIQLLPYQGPSGNFIFVCQLIYIGFVVYYTIIEIRSLRRLGKAYFKQFTTYIELLIIIFSYTGVVITIIRSYEVNKILRRFKETQGNYYVNIQQCYYLTSMLKLLIALVVFLGMVKFTKLLRFNRRLAAIGETLKRCSNDLGGFSFIFVVVFTAFGFLFHCMFSKSSHKYSSVTGTIISLFSISVYKFDYKTYKNDHPILGPIAFFSFAFITSLILVNLFLTIIIRSFERVKHDLKKRSESHMTKFVVQKLKGILGFKSRNPQNQSLIILPPTSDGDASNTPAQQFPQKVDKLLDYVNTVYFDGKANFQDKRWMYRRHKYNYKEPTMLNSEHTVFKSD